ncbi:hypothetical protein T484DRAFT_1894352 [Baffinella frigidus]|nr:hypothetical protein T484DRAFT_1894352 [Cryptophyta sp. CCMP2293]
MQASSEVSLAMAILARELGQPNLTIEDVRRAVASKAASSAANEASNLASSAANEASNLASQDGVFDGVGIWKGLSKPLKRVKARARNCLLRQQVLEIFGQRPKMSAGRMRRGSMVLCKTLAPKYGVTAKTIREIWRGLTWTETTLPMWTQEEISARLRGAEEDDEDDATNSPITPPAAHEPSHTSTVSLTSPKPSLTDASASTFAATASSASGRNFVNMVQALAMHSSAPPADFGASANLPYPSSANLAYPAAFNAPVNTPGSSMAVPAPHGCLHNPALNRQSFHGCQLALHPQSFHLPAHLQIAPLLAAAPPNTYAFASPQPNHRIASSHPPVPAFAAAQPNHHGLTLPPVFLASYMTSSGAAFQNAENAFSSGFASPNL